MNRFYYKIRIIATFCVIAVLLVILIARFSYLFVRNLYLDQLGEQVNTVTKMLSEQLDDKYIKFLDLGSPTKETEKYFRKIFRKNFNSSARPEIFIFDNNFDIIIHSDSSVKSGTYYSKLLLNKKEIIQLQINASTASIPFKGENGKWYLWGFCRLTPDIWLAVKESALRMEKVNELSTVFLYFGISATIIVVLVAFFLAKSITSPLDKLVLFSKELGKGNFQAKIPEKTKGEIRVLAESMSFMKNEISKHQKEKENMLAQIAHEIRNPLGGIELLAGLVKEDQQKRNKNTEYLSMILSEINRLKSLIISFLNFSKPASAKPSKTDVENTIKEIEEIYCEKLEEKKITFIKNIEDQYILFDPSQLKQVLMNLLSNSIDSVSVNGNINVSLKKNAKYKILSVSDDGTGIAEKNIGLVFNPFFTLRKDGTGLGLAISKKLCAENKAELTVKNNNKNGCTFSIIKEISNES